MMSGRYINELDIKNKSKHAVIGRLVARDLFKQEDPIGKFIDVGNSVFKVVGVFKTTVGITRNVLFIFLIQPDNPSKKEMIS